MAGSRPVQQAYCCRRRSLTIAITAIASSDWNIAATVRGRRGTTLPAPDGKLRRLLCGTRLPLHLGTRQSAVVGVIAAEYPGKTAIDGGSRCPPSNEAPERNTCHHATAKKQGIDAHDFLELLYECRFPCHRYLNLFHVACSLRSVRASGYGFRVEGTSGRTGARPLLVRSNVR